MIPFKPSPNFTPGDINPLGYCLHGTLGNYDGAVNWLCTPAEKRNPISYSSAHFVIAKDGRAVQLVSIKDKSWHAGTVNNPSEFAKSVLPRNILGGFKNPNDSFIGIELEWFEGDYITQPQMAKLIEVIKECNIKDPVFIGHTDISSFKKDDMEFVCKDLRKYFSVKDISIQDAIHKIEEGLLVLKTKL